MNDTQTRCGTGRCAHRALFLSISSFIALCSLTALSAPTLLAQEAPVPETINAPAPEEAQPAADDVLKLGAFVVVGTPTPKTKLESALAVTTVDLGQVERIAPRSTAELLKVVPGLYVESTGGEANNNIVARGTVSDGGYFFVALQEDGLPVISESEMSFSSADNYTRISNWIQNVEALRGGSAGVFQSSAPLGVVNFISREGGPDTRGEVHFRVGDYGLYRTEMWQSGPAGPNNTYAIGGFYRVDDGIRDPGYKANEGGQIAANFKHTFSDNRGYLKVSGKAMDDRTQFLLPIPLQNQLDPQTIPGGPDIRDGASSSKDIRRFHFPGSPVGAIDWDLADGIQVRVSYIGTDLELKLTDTLTLKNLNRYTYADKSWNANPFGTATPLQDIANTLGANANSAGQFANAIDANGDYRFRLRLPSRGGQIVAANAAEAATLNGNGLGVLDGWWHSAAKLENIQDDLRLIQSFNDGRTQLTGGFYYAYLEDERQWFFNQNLLDVSSSFQRLDLEYLDANGASLGTYTYNGISQLGNFYRNDDGEVTDTSPYVNLSHKIGSLDLDAGVRYQRVKLKARVEQLGTYDSNTFLPGGGNYPALRNATYGNGVFTTAEQTATDHALTVGANYAFSSREAVFARFSRGPRMPNTNQIMDAARASTNDIGQTQKITQYELGFKYARAKAGVFLTLFHTQQRNQTASDVIFGPNNTIIVRNNTRDVDVNGAEIEALWNPVSGLTVELHATYQDPEFANERNIAATDPAGNPILIALEGNRPVRIPKEYGSLSATYQLPAFSFGTLEVHGSWQYTGERWADEANTSPLDDFSEFAAGLALTTRNGFVFRVQASNLFNSEGLTEGDPRTSQIVADVTAAYFNARPVLPRTVIASVTYQF